MQKLTLATLSTLALSLLCTSVFAVDGKITVNGVVTDQTCTLQGYQGPVTGVKDLTVSMPAVLKSEFNSSILTAKPKYIQMRITNATGTGWCNAATTAAFKGIHLSVSSPPNDLDTTDKSLLVNKAEGAPTINPVFIQIRTGKNRIIDFSAPWGTQAASEILISTFFSVVDYYLMYASKTGIVAPQKVHAVVNYTMHYN